MKTKTCLIAILLAGGLISSRAQDTDVAQATSEWGTASLIETNTSSADGSRLGMDADGNAITVWSQGDGTYVSVWANRYVAGVGWGDASLIETNPGDANMPRVAVDGKGNAMALWKQSNGVNYDIWANRYDVGSGWGTATLIETEPDNADLPKVEMDGRGNAVAVWAQAGSIWANRFSTVQILTEMGEGIETIKKEPPPGERRQLARTGGGHP